MTDNSQLVKRLRKDVFYGDERMRKMHLHNPLHMEAADAIEALEARVAELEAGLRPFSEAGSTALISGNPPANHVDASCFIAARALLERNPS